MRVRASVYNGYLQGRVTITPTLPGLGLLRLRSEHVTQPSMRRGEHSNRMPHRRGVVYCKN